MQFKSLNTRTKVILILQTAGMLAGVSTHTSWLLRHGFMAEEYGAGLFSMIFWDSLIFLDATAALLLILRPKPGIWMTLFIILIDVVHTTCSISGTCTWKSKD